MSDLPVPTPGQAEGTAQGSTPAAPAAETTGPDGAKKGYVTREEAAALKEEILNQARSYSDKGRVRVENSVKAVTQSVAILRANGQQITPDQEKALKDEAARKAMVEPEPGSTDGQQAPQAGAQQGPIDPNVLEIEQDKGVILYDDDPELAMIDRSKTQMVFYKSVEAACEAKKARLASQPQSTSPSSRVPPSGAPSSISNLTGREYLEGAHKNKG